MNLLSFPDNIIKKSFWIGIIAILISVVTWSLDLTNMVYECPYCRTQRTVIGLLGLALLMPFCYHWSIKLASVAIGFFGAVVGAMQHFRGWARVSSGEFKFNQNIFIDSTILSGLAIFTILFLVILILQKYNADS